MIESETCVLAKTRIGPSTLASRWWRTMAGTPAPLARAAAMYSRPFTCTVADSATRTTRGTKTIESEISVLARPGPSAPEMAIASKTAGKA
jgi:hypothetical protein